MKILPIKVYIGIWLALIVGFVLSTGLSLLDLGPFNVVICVSIAFCQMILAILFFMHVRFSSRLVWIFAASGFYWIGVMFVLGLNDYLTRGVSF